jgi:predicted Rossmann fold flavoprotein
MFPVTDSSETIIDCLVNEAKAAGVRLYSRSGVEEASRFGAGFELRFVGDIVKNCDRLLLATGGTRSSSGERLAQSLGHTLLPAVPSLFSFHVRNEWLRSLPGVSVPDIEASVPGTKLRERGPMLITHQGVSGPGILRLSAWGARALHGLDYEFTLRLNWLPDLGEDTLRGRLRALRDSNPTRRVLNSPIAPLPARLWEQLGLTAGISHDTLWANLSRANANALVSVLLRSELEVNGKSLNKDEFVTCGGVDLHEIDFKTMESRLTPGLYFAGELIDVDGITGGFNFQAAWATGWIAGNAMAG